MEGKSKGDVAKELGINPNTLSAWLKEDEFIAEYNIAIAQKFLDINPSIIDRLVQIANSRNENAAVAACKELLSRGGVAAVQKIETTGEVTIAVSVDEGGDA